MRHSQQGERRTGNIFGRHSSKHAFLRGSSLDSAAMYALLPVEVGTLALTDWVELLTPPHEGDLDLINLKCPVNKYTLYITSMCTTPRPVL
jgi:hypothetical protein